MTTPLDIVIVAVSGGADSVALLHALWSLRGELGVGLVAAHLNHGIRGDEAATDAEFVRELALRLGVDSVIEKADVPKLRVEMGVGMEEAARVARYEFLERTAEKVGAARIAVAHTSDDQAETVLLNIIRGTGPEGLAGMPTVRGKIIRPLIELSRAEVESYLLDVGLSWRTDSSNLESEYSRNRVRLELIPLIEREFNPRVKDSLVSLSKLVASENEIVRTAGAEAYLRSVREDGTGAVEFHASRLRDDRLAVKRRVIRAAIEQVKGDLRDVEFHQVERIIKHLNAHDSITLTLPSGMVYARITPTKLRVFRAPKYAVLDIHYPINVPGTTEIPELDGVIDARPVPPKVRPTSPEQAIIDPSKVVGRLVLRTWNEGDRVIPLGMQGHKKLQDIFVDKKVSRTERGLVPVIADNEKIVWVAGLVVSELVKIEPGCESALMLEWKPPPMKEGTDGSTEQNRRKP